MNHDELRTRMADYLDGLLDEQEAREVEARIAEEPALLAEVARMRAVLYRPYAVPPPREDQPARILHRFGDRALARVVRYAAVFAAGVLTALLVTLPARSAPVTPTAIEPPAELPAAAPQTQIHNLRIR